MEFNISSASTAMQQRGATKAPQSNPEPVVMTRQEVQAMRDNIRQQIRAGIAGAGQGVTAPTPPTPPEAPRMITVRGSDGQTTVIGVPPGLGSDVIPPQAVDISIAFFITIAAIIIGLPIARAFGRRMDRRGGAAQIPGDLSNQINQLNQAVDAIALEVERISEGQRFTTRLLSEQRDAARTSIPTSTSR